VTIVNIETAIKLTVFIFLIVIPGIFIHRMLTSKNKCETAVIAYVQANKVNSPFPEAKAKEAEMQKICKAMGVQAEAYLNILTPTK